MTGSIYAPDYLRKQTDEQLHLIADTMETNLNTMSNLRIENADLHGQVELLKSNTEKDFKDIQDLKQQIADYEKACLELRKHSRHSHSCSIRSMDAECDCGHNNAVNLYENLTKYRGQNG